MVNQNADHPPVIDYEGSDYQTSFWKEGGREYEDRCEQIALRRLLPDQGELLLEIGAGAGRNTPRYKGFKRVVVNDFSLTQLQQAQEYLGKSDKYTYVAGDVYRLPFVDNLFDGATMIRVLHHMQDPASALAQISRVLQNDTPFLLEFANKQNLKAILRYWLGRQEWDPFSLEAIEFEKLNFDFHPKSVKALLSDASFRLERQLTVSHFRLNFLKKLIPTGILVALDGLAQFTGNWWQLSPSVFTRNITEKPGEESSPSGFFQCPACRNSLPLADPGADMLVCPSCSRTYPIVDGIYDFRN